MGGMGSIILQMDITLKAEQKFPQFSLCFQVVLFLVCDRTSTIVQQPKANFLANPLSPDKVFFLRIIYLLDVYNKIQVGVELLPLGNSRNSRWRPT